MLHNYKVEMEEGFKFSWNGLMECLRHSDATLMSIHLYKDDDLKVMINEKLDFVRQYILTEESRKRLNAKFSNKKSKNIIEALTSRPNYGYVIIKVAVDKRSLDRWNSFNFMLKEV
ncbi:hypothetical protein U8V72_15320 [Priestia filamentosa]|uniref:hypothetical protein n=1 Tax=Priestia filamentosa TaxID=1402861 RepID=UPI000589674F